MRINIPDFYETGLIIDAVRDALREFLLVSVVGVVQVWTRERVGRSILQNQFMI